MIEVFAWIMLISVFIMTAGGVGILTMDAQEERKNKKRQYPYREYRRKMDE